MPSQIIALVIAVDIKNKNIMLFLLVSFKLSLISSTEYTSANCLSTDISFNISLTFISLYSNLPFITLLIANLNAILFFLSRSLLSQNSLKFFLLTAMLLKLSKSIISA